jgi:hypothetical protein
MSQGGNSGVSFAGWVIGLLILFALLLPLACLAGVTFLAMFGGVQ